MKTVTQARIVKAHEKWSKWVNSKKEDKIYSKLVSHGLHTLLPGNQERNNQTLQLELNLLGAFDLADVCRRLAQAGISSKSLEEWLPRFDGLKDQQAFCLAAWIALQKHTHGRAQRKRQDLLRIQVENEVSGLVDETIDFGHTQLTIKTDALKLILIPSDNKTLSEQRFEMADAFVRAVHVNRMKLYQELEVPGSCYGMWEPCSTDYVLGAIARSNHAICWSDLCFTNRKELETTGRTQPTRVPISPDHEKEWEIHLSCATGLLNDSNPDSWWHFCAYIGSGMPCVG